MGGSERRQALRVHENVLPFCDWGGVRAACVYKDYFRFRLSLSFRAREDQRDRPRAHFRGENKTKQNKKRFPSLVFEQ